NPQGGVYLGTPDAAVLTVATDDDQTQIVTNTNDGGAGSLRQAILNANASFYASTVVNFASPLFDSPQIITLSGQTGFRTLTSTKSITINGRGANLLTIRRAANDAVHFRIFYLTGAANVLNGMTVSGGSMVSGNGADGGGSAIVSLGSTSVNGCLITDNHTVRLGGAVINGSGVMTIQNSTISGNSSAGFGGGILNVGTLNLISSTVSGNVNNGSDGHGRGGGIYTQGTVNIRNSTITDNASPNGDDGTGIYNDAAAPITISGSIIAANRNSADQADVAFDTVYTGDSYVSEGYNLIGSVTATNAFNQTGDQVGTTGARLNPRLAPLADYGGSTPTHALYFNSTAINRIPASFTNLPPIDQRGEARVINTRADIGAYELNLQLSFTPLGANRETLPNGQTGQSYSVQFSAARPANFAAPFEATMDSLEADGNVGATAYSIISGGLPNGLTLNATGILSGTATTGGIFNFVLKATDAHGMAAAQTFTLNILAPTTAAVAVGGRVTTADNRGIRQALVTIMDASSGNAQTILTGNSGNYRFTNVAAGGTYVFTVNSKRYEFSQPVQVLNINDGTEEVNFIALPQ
ncbi:MAG TPA: choice-of-anchor Q domain-containing protein, partial [Pyrinomonadaceae bacterium]|nr:choice-of-anchor Q domain-containing protein [Pyrinomonadaceae bacterium]